MKIHFKTRKLRELLEERTQAMKELGKAGTKKLAVRRGELEAAVSVTDLRTGDHHD